VLVVAPLAQQGVDLVDEDDRGLELVGWIFFFFFLLLKVVFFFFFFGKRKRKKKRKNLKKTKKYPF